MNELILQNI